MIPLSLVTGFLGSGKTTLLQHFIDQNRGRRIAYIVNEFGAADIDGRRLELPDGELVTIPGGSIFCRCVSGEFIRVLQTVAEANGDSGKGLDGVIIEASGIANPKVIAQMLEETRLDQVYELRTIMTVVDPGSFRKLIHTLPNIIAQVESCHVAIINKMDRYNKATMQEVHDEIVRINPGAEVIRALYCHINMDPFTDRSPRELQGEYAPCADPNYVTQTCSVESPVDARRVQAELQAIRKDLYRAKGYVPVPDGLLYVDLLPTGLRLCPEPAPATGQAGPLVIIARPEARECVEAFMTKLKEGEFAAPVG